MSYSCYIKLPDGWTRSRSLDLICAEQRLSKICRKNGFRGRKYYLVGAFRYHISQGRSRHEAYTQACMTQVTNPSIKEINIDSRTTWINPNNV